MSNIPSKDGQKHSRQYRKRNIECRSKVKTGCKTCRIRKVKCDENKPSCQKCVNTGRTCDGYESPFRLFTSQPINGAHANGIKSNVDFSTPIRPTHLNVTPQEIDLLNRYFSTKTIFDVQLGCDEEARQVLQASVTDPSIRHAVSSLQALREDLEKSGDSPPAPASIVQQTPTYHYGLEQYSMALGGLASKLSSSSPAGSFSGLKSALLCCQIFISIEQVQKNYAAMAQHIIRGLGIMHEYRVASPAAAQNRHDDDIPLLDVFIIKMFAAPCKFADPPAAPADAQAMGTTTSTPLSTSSVPSHQEHPIDNTTPPLPLRPLLPDMRTKLVQIATSTLFLLTKPPPPPSLPPTAGSTPPNLSHPQSETQTLLLSLETWLNDLNRLQTITGPAGLEEESISTSFLRLFHQVLKVILAGALVVDSYSSSSTTSSPSLSSSSSLRDRNVELIRTENGRLQSVANKVGERVRGYVMCSGTSTGTGGSTCKK